jgi:UDP-N-acetyl-D-galactosamine dehydrogenase
LSWNIYKNYPEASAEGSWGSSKMVAERVIGVIGLGYVGLPVTVEFAKKFDTVGFDVNASRVEELLHGFDKNGEIDSTELKAPRLTLTTDLQELKKANFFIVAVPTPIDEAKRPRPHTDFKSL